MQYEQEKAQKMIDDEEKSQKMQEDEEKAEKKSIEHYKCLLFDREKKTVLTKNKDSWCSIAMGIVVILLIFAVVYRTVREGQTENKKNSQINSTGRYFHNLADHKLKDQSIEVFVNRKENGKGAEGLNIPIIIIEEPKIQNETSRQKRSLISASGTTTLNQTDATNNTAYLLQPLVLQKVVKRETHIQKIKKKDHRNNVTLHNDNNIKSKIGDIKYGSQTDLRDPKILKEFVHNTVQRMVRFLNNSNISDIHNTSNEYDTNRSPYIIKMQPLFPNVTERPLISIEQMEGNMDKNIVETKNYIKNKLPFQIDVDIPNQSDTYHRHPFFHTHTKKCMKSRKMLMKPLKVFLNKLFVNNPFNLNLNENASRVLIDALGVISLKVSKEEEKSRLLKKNDTNIDKNDFWIEEVTESTTEKNKKHGKNEFPEFKNALNGIWIEEVFNSTEVAK